MALGDAHDLGAREAHSRVRLACYKVPSRIVVVDELPSNAVGKIDTARLRALASAAVLP
ncbi:MAG: hypothetical protein ACYCPK_07420 [Acidimicrobiales bacterium]